MPLGVVSATGVLEILWGGGTVDPGDCADGRGVPGDAGDRAVPGEHTRRSRTSDVCGRPATALPLRTLLQLVFLVAVLVAGFPGAFSVWS